MSQKNIRLINFSFLTILLGPLDVVPPVIAETNNHVFHQYSIRVKDRDGLQNYLQEAGIVIFCQCQKCCNAVSAFRAYGEHGILFIAGFNIKCKPVGLACQQCNYLAK